MTDLPAYSVQDTRAQSTQQDPDLPTWQPAREESHYQGKLRDASFHDFEEGITFCQRNPIFPPLEITPQLRQFVTGLDAYTFLPNFYFHGKIKERHGLVHVQTESSQLDCSVVSNLPILFANARHLGEGVYLELHITSLRKNGIVSFGLAQVPYPPFRQPGWNRSSCAVFSDDGRKFFEDGYGGREYTSPICAGDVISLVILNAALGTVTYQQNGVSLGPAFDGLFFPRDKCDVYAALGFEGHVECTVNFGAHAWKYPPPSSFSPLNVLWKQ